MGLRSLFSIAAALLVLSGAVAPTAAQDANIQPAFSDSILRTLGYPEIQIEVSPEGVTAPSTLSAWFYLVTLSATDGNVAYLDFMQPPAGLDTATATELALAAARDDLAQEGWVYAGGSNTFEPGVPVSFVIQFAPGEYQIAASIYAPEQGSEETMRLLPLTVTSPVADGGTPGPVGSPSPTGTPRAAAPDAGVTLEMTDDLRYIVGPDPVPAGPQVWEITNTGTHGAHHAVIWRVPDGVTAEVIVADFSVLMSGTPPAGPPLMAQFTGVAYGALQSGGQTTWAEFDLQPGTYAVICYIIDPVTERPHVLDGMVTVFTVA